MPTCKFCGKSGLFHKVTKNGMCSGCEEFVSMDFKNRTRIYYESKTLIESTENPDVVISRIKTIKEQLSHLLEYEKKGIGVFQIPPSALLIDIEKKQDELILDCFERSYESLKLKLNSYKTDSAKLKNMERFLTKIDQYMPELNNSTELNRFRVRILKTIPNVSRQIGQESAAKPKKTSPKKTIITENTLRVIEIHPARLLYLEKKSPEDIKLSGGIRITMNLVGEISSEVINPYEPSTIFEDLPVKKPKNINLVERLPYSPKYSEISPEQRWIYLQWVKNISQPIDIGYVFLYYYGLERQLILGDFDTACHEIEFLRGLFDNKSFESYSYNALLFASGLKNRIDKIENTLLNQSRNGIDNIDLIFKYRFRLGIGLEEFMGLAKRIKGVNQRYLTAVPDRYRAALSVLFIDKFGMDEYPFYDRFDIEGLPKFPTRAFANVSFPETLRTPLLPDIIRYEPFVNECIGIFSDAHSMVKQDLINDRLIKDG